MYEVEINGTDYTDKTTAIELNEGLGELGAFKVKLFDVDGLAPTDIRENRLVRLKSDGVQFFKGLTTNVTYTSSSEVELNGLDMGVKLLRRKMDRYQATNRAPTGASPSILTDLVSENQNGTGANIIDIGENAAIPDGVTMSYRGEQNNRLRGISAVMEAIGWDWWIDQDISDNDQINVHSHRGSTTSVFTFTPDTNCAISTKEKDLESTVNWITLYGHEGIKTDFFAASDVYTTLLGPTTATATTISCVDLSSFPAGAGYFKIGSEYVYGTKSGNNIGVTATGRGIVKYGTGTVSGSVLTHSGMNWETDQFTGHILRVNSVDYPIVSNTADTITVTGTPASGSQAYTVRQSSPAFEHYGGCAVFEYDFGTEYTPLSPKVGSPIELYGIRETRETRRDIGTLANLELVASRYMLYKSIPVERNIIYPDEPEEVINEIELGDVITLNDENAGFSSSEYRCVGRRLRINLQSGLEEIEYQVNDKATNFVKIVADDVTQIETDISAIDVAEGEKVLTTKGDLYGYDVADTRIPVGTDGQVLTADSAQSAGVKWGSPPGQNWNFIGGARLTSAASQLDVSFGEYELLYIRMFISSLSGVMSGKIFLSPNDNTTWSTMAFRYSENGATYSVYSTTVPYFIMDANWSGTGQRVYDILVFNPASGNKLFKWTTIWGTGAHASPPTIVECLGTKILASRMTWFRITGTGGANLGAGSYAMVWGANY